jgi:putative metallohydrolase (TIGR04338 family)
VTRSAAPATPRARPGPASGGSSDRDAQRSRVYRAEDAWAARLDAARLGATLATVAGSSVLLPAERRFGTLETATDYAAAVLALPPVAAVAGELPAPALRVRRGVTAAHWEPPGVIALPVPRHGEPWALRESVLLHELAHHVATLTGRARGHRPPFPAVVLLLVQAALGPEAALALRVDYGREAVETGQL